MADGQPNPYAAPTGDLSADVSSGIDASSLIKIEAIIKDAGQVWLAIILCILCSGFGMLIIGPWYIVRLIQWSSLSKQYPSLLDRNVPRGSLPQKFRSARTKLIVGIVFGALIPIILIALLLPAVYVSRSAAP